MSLCLAGEFPELGPLFCPSLPPTLLQQPLQRMPPELESAMTEFCQQEDVISKVQIGIRILAEHNFIHSSTRRPFHDPVHTRSKRIQCNNTALANTKSDLEPYDWRRLFDSKLNITLDVSGGFGRSMDKVTDLPPLSGENWKALL